MVSYISLSLLGLEKMVKGLNPYCSGQWSRTHTAMSARQIAEASLNPYCSGQWSRTGTPVVSARDKNQS